MPYFELQEEDTSFPPAYFAGIDGLLAVGGTMSLERLVLAYNSGIYYWHFPLKHVQWWSPDPRIVIRPGSFIIDSDKWQTLQQEFGVSFDAHFEKVIRACQNTYNIKERMDHTWLTERMARIFLELHHKGYAHSVEVWQNEKFVGGMFGVAIGKLFFGEYLFAEVENAKEFALLYLVNKLKEEGYTLIDMQKETIFLPGLDYDEVPRLEYVNICKENAEKFPNVLPKF